LDWLLIHLDVGIVFGVLLAVTAVVGDSSRREIDIVADNPTTTNT
jgi:hypothetical protein